MRKIRLVVNEFKIKAKIKIHSKVKVTTIETFPA